MPEEKLLKKLISSIWFILVCATILIAPLSGFAEKRADGAMDDSFLNSSSSNQTTSNSRWMLHGFMENENYFPVSETSSRESTSILKEETRLNVNIRYGSHSYYARVIADFYHYQQPTAYALPRQSESGEIQEAYLHAGDLYSLRIGKQLFHWGRADLFPVTNFLDQRDYRELFSQDKEDQRQGVYAIKGKLIWKNFSFESALVPVFSPPLLPQIDQEGKRPFWNLVPESYTLDIPEAMQPYFGGSQQISLQPQLVESQHPGTAWKHISGALRGGYTAANLDLFISYYHGLDNRPLLLADAKISGTTPPWSVTSVTIQPQYESIDQFGLETALSLGRFSIRAEGSYTMQKSLVVKDEYTLSQQSDGAHLLPKVQKAPYFAYTIGVDANLWGDDGRVLLEWTQAIPGQHQSRYADELFTNILLLRIEDKFFNKQLTIEAGSLLRPDHESIGYAPYLNFGWDFQNGLEIKMGAMVFGASSEPLFAMLADNDFFFLKARYSF